MATINISIPEKLKEQASFY